MDKKQSDENLREAAALVSVIAEKNGAAIIVVDKNQAVVVEANNNSICHYLYQSDEFAPLCDKYCGRAFQRAAEAGETVAYTCHAGLDCRAVPLPLLSTGEKQPQLVAITGRVFTKSENYRRAAERAAAGDWRAFPADSFFENVLLGGASANLDSAASSLKKLNQAETETLLQAASGKTAVKAEDFEASAAEPEIISPRKLSQENKIEQRFADQFQKTAQPTKDLNLQTTKSTGAVEEIAEWRSLFGSLLDLDYKKACVSILRFLGKRYRLDSLAWLERRENRFEVVFSAGKLKNQQMQVGIAADNQRLIEAARRETSIELRDRKSAGKEEEAAAAKAQTIRLFPIAVGGEIRSGLLVGDPTVAPGTQRQIARFCQTVASELEILRLREELSRRGWLTRAVQRFNENVRKIDSEDFWLNLAQIFAELMKAERSSLMIFDEKSDSLVVKAAIGLTADVIKNETKTLGARVAAQVLSDGRPLVVEDVEKTEMPSAPPDWQYKSNSFISYPIEIGGRKIGVLNLTDKIGGEEYNRFDLDLLHAIVPQLAVLIDRADLKHKAGEFQHLSVTDALTGLLNRRYLEERLTEEIKRSNRHGFPMSFMMIDVDDFKSYNDNFSHPEGDKALKIVANCLKETLRGADIAARYGGEEFSILLPQTTSAEAQIIAERIRERVDSADFPNRRVTASIGVASCSQRLCTASDIIKAADDALYEAKRRGRNNVQVYENLNNGHLHR